jgi:hypothetical protein
MVLALLSSADKRGLMFWRNLSADVLLIEEVRQADRMNPVQRPQAEVRPASELAATHPAVAIRR